MRKRIHTRHYMPQLHVELEHWKYNVRVDAYISTFGNIRNAAGETLTPCAFKNYLYFRGVPLHRLVMECFDPAPGWQNLTVDHKNHNTRDNHLSNLEWVTQKENAERAQDDYDKNKPVEMETASIQTNAYVLLNGVKLPLNDAREIVLKVKGLASCKPKVNEVFDNFMSDPKAIEFGGFIIQRVEA